jgi:hypothetical protein
MTKQHTGDELHSEYLLIKLERYFGILHTYHGVIELHFELSTSRLGSQYPLPERRPFLLSEPCFNNGKRGSECGITKWRKVTHGHAGG